MTELPHAAAPLPINSGDWITQLAGGANLVDGKQTWQHAEESKHDLDVMLRCCDAELETMRRTGLVAAPFYFERAAILLRKAKEFALEIQVCERYAQAIGAYYAGVAEGTVADVRKARFFASIPKRVTKARALLSKAKQPT